MTEGRTPAEMAGLYEWPRVVAVTGALGSGKTEFVLNLARGLKERGERVTIADADIINPYFCIRQVADQLEREGFTVLTPPEAAKWSDMSIINPAISRAIVDGSARLILDIGGDAVGVRALTQFAPGIACVKLIDAAPIGINIRSTVATYANLHDELRRIYEIGRAHV